MNLGELISNTKEFIFDIIGYIIPGFYAILLLSTCVNTIYFFQISDVTILEQTGSMILIAISYIIGHGIYLLSNWTDKVTSRIKFLSINTDDKIWKCIANSIEYKLTLIALNELYNAKNDLKVDINVEKEKSIRNLIMSYLPETDIKVYTFMFRAELSRVIGTLNLVIASLGFISIIFDLLNIGMEIFSTSNNCILLYTLLFVSYFLFDYTKGRFKRIAYSLPFTVFVSKYYPLKQ